MTTKEPGLQMEEGVVGSNVAVLLIFSQIIFIHFLLTRKMDMLFSFLSLDCLVHAFLWLLLLPLLLKPMLLLLLVLELELELTKLRLHGSN